MNNWRNIAAIATDGYQTVGLKKNGKVIAIGDTRDGECNVFAWQDIMAIAAGANHTIGLKKDETLVAVGENKYGQTNIDTLEKLF